MLHEHLGPPARAAPPRPPNFGTRHGESGTEHDQQRSGRQQLPLVRRRIAVDDRRPDTTRQLRSRPGTRLTISLHPTIERPYRVACSGVAPTIEEQAGTSRYARTGRPTARLCRAPLPDRGACAHGRLPDRGLRRRVRPMSRPARTACLRDRAQGDEVDAGFDLLVCACSFPERRRRGAGASVKRPAHVPVDSRPTAARTSRPRWHPAGGHRGRRTPAEGGGAMGGKDAAASAGPRPGYRGCEGGPARAGHLADT